MIMIFPAAVNCLRVPVFPCCSPLQCHTPLQLSEVRGRQWGKEWAAQVEKRSITYKDPPPSGRPVCGFLKSSLPLIRK